MSDLIERLQERQRIAAAGITDPETRRIVMNGHRDYDDARANNGR